MTERQLRCPSCDAPMQTVERRGVLIDICRDCRGVYLDRGELDKLLDLASRDVETAVAAGQTAARSDDASTSSDADPPSPLAGEAETFRHDREASPERSWRRERDWDDDDDDLRRYDDDDNRRWGRGRRSWFDIFDLD